jgi:D-apiose dehydrogenase
MGAKALISVACAGAGYFAAFHYDAWRRQEKVKLVAACDHDQMRAEATGLPAFADLAKMLETCRPDLLDIILPPPAHRQAITTAIDAGVRVVICQKPFCTSLEEAREMADLAEKTKTTLIIHENFRFQPWYRTMRDIIDNGDLGDVQQFTFRLRTGDGQGADAYLGRQPYFRQMPRLLVHETGVHWIDTFRFMLGEPTAVYADLRRLNPVISGEDAGYFIMDFGADKRALFDGNRLLDHAAENHRTTLGEALIEGTHGTATLDGFGQVAIRSFGATEQRIVLGARAWSGFAGDCVKALNDHVVDAMLAGSRPENLASDYLSVIAIKDAIYTSAEKGVKIHGPF